MSEKKNKRQEVVFIGITPSSNGASPDFKLFISGGEPLIVPQAPIEIEINSSVRANGVFVKTQGDHTFLVATRKSLIKALFSMCSIPYPVTTPADG